MRFFPILGALLGLLAYGAGAFANPQEIEERARARKEIVQLIKGGAESGDRIAAFEFAMQKNDTELRLDAMEAALASKDTRLRKKALRHQLSNGSSLRLELLLPDNPNPGQKLIFGQYHGLVLESIKIDPQNDAIITGRYTGQLVQDGFEITLKQMQYHCAVKMRVANTSQMAGQIDCVMYDANWIRANSGQSRAVIPVTINLF